MSDQTMAPLPAPQEADFLGLLQNLLPRGRAWPRDPDANLTDVLSGLALAQANARARQIELPSDAFPTTTEELLPEWEETLGLPDPCLGPNPTVAARKAAVDARIEATGGQSVPYFQQLAVNLGGAITITEYAPFRAQIDKSQKPLYTLGWAYIWTVTLTSGALFRFEAQSSGSQEPLWQLANQPISCEIVRLRPAHTQVNFAIGAGVPTVGFFLTDLSLTDSFAVVE